jgi:hypothetical protein
MFQKKTLTTCSIYGKKICTLPKLSSASRFRLRFTDQKSQMLYVIARTHSVISGKHFKLVSTIIILVNTLCLNSYNCFFKLSIVYL